MIETSLSCTACVKQLGNFIQTSMTSKVACLDICHKYASKLLVFNSFYFCRLNGINMSIACQHKRPTTLGVSSFKKFQQIFLTIYRTDYTEMYYRIRVVRPVFARLLLRFWDVFFLSMNIERFINNFIAHHPCYITPGLNSFAIKFRWFHNTCSKTRLTENVFL